MTKEQIENKVIEVISAVLKVPVSADSSHETLKAWDSLKHVEIIFALEDEFDVMFEEEILPELNGVQKIAQWLLDNA